MIKKSVIFALVSLVVLGAHGPAHGAGGSGATPDFSANYTISVAAFDGPGCVEALITLNYAKMGADADDIAATVAFDARYDGSSSSMTGSVYVGYSKPGSATASDAYLYVCPFEINDGVGPIRVNGTVESEVFTQSKIRAPLSGSDLVVAQNPTKLSKPKVKTTNGFISYREVSGQATATTLSKGVIGADGRLTLSVKKKGSKKFAEVSTTSADEFGNWDFNYVSTSRMPRGSTFTVTVSECGWCTSTQVTGKVK